MQTWVGLIGLFPDSHRDYGRIFKGIVELIKNLPLNKNNQILAK
jgi:hypothetical protein